MYICIKKIDAMNLKSWIGFTILSLGILTFSSCDKIKGKGGIVSQTRNVTGFTGVSLSINATVYFSTDTLYYLEIKAQQNILDILESDVGGNNNLLLQYRKGVIVGRHEHIEIFIAGPDVHTLNVSGSGEIFVTNPWISSYLKTIISGSGNISVPQIDAGELHATISGSGNIQATSGTVNYETLRISGSGNIDLLGVEADTTFATISGSGNISVWVTKLLDATISGSGNIRYKGDPVVKSHVSGSGSIIKI